MTILLDIDGVMVTTGAWKRVEILEDNFSAFNQRAAENLKKILSETNASIVLTSSHKSRFNSVEWKQIFKRRGINVHSLKRLKENSSNLNRKDEIINWIKEKHLKSAFVIIDDDSSLNSLPDTLRRHCVITKPLIGLDEDATSNAISILKDSRITSKSKGRKIVSV